jgi:hypothetical protein
MPYETYQLEPVGAVPFIGGPDDPIKQYGERATEYMMARLERVPADQRAAALELALKAIDPTLPGRVERKERTFVGRGDPPDLAQRRAIAASLSEGMLREMVGMGRGKPPASRSVLGLGVWHDRAPQAQQALGEEIVKSRRGRRLTAAERKALQYKYGRGTDADPWRFPPGMIDRTVRDHRIINLPPIQKAYKAAIKRYGKMPSWMGERFEALVREGKIPFITFKLAKSTVVRGRTLRKGQKMGVYFDERVKTMQIRKIPKRKKRLLKKLGSSLKSLGKGLLAGPKKLADLAAKGAKKLYEAGADIIDKLGDLACGVVNHPAAQAAAAGGAAAYGAPPQAGEIGVGLAKNLCGGADVPGVPPEDLMAPPARRLPGWVLPVALGGGALVLVLALRRRT